MIQNNFCRKCGAGRHEISMTGEGVCLVCDNQMKESDLKIVIQDALRVVSIKSGQIQISKEAAESLVKRGMEVMCKEYGDDDDWVGMTADDLDEETGKFDDDYQTFEIWL